MPLPLPLTAVRGYRFRRRLDEDRPHGVRAVRAPADRRTHPTRYIRFPDDLLIAGRVLVASVNEGPSNDQSGTGPVLGGLPFSGVLERLAALGLTQVEEDRLSFAFGREVIDKIGPFLLSDAVGGR